MSLFPTVLWLFGYLTQTQNSPHSSLNVIYCLIITAWQWLMSFTHMPCIPMQIKPNKSPLRNRLKALLLWKIGHLSAAIRSCLGRIILIEDGQGGSAGQSPPTLAYLTELAIFQIEWSLVGTIRYGLYNFFSLTICLIALLRGTAGQMDTHLCLCFPHSAFKVAQMEAKKDLEKQRRW